jgi:hypothetical protein
MRLGETELTRMPSGASCTAMERVRFNTPAFAVVYAVASFPAPVARRRRHVDDPAFALLIDHHFRRRASAIPHAAHTHVHRPVPLLFSDIEERFVIGPCRVIDQNIDTAELFHYGLHHGVDRRRVGHITHHRDRFAGFFAFISPATLLPRPWILNRPQRPWRLHRQIVCSHLRQYCGPRR